MEIQTGQMVVNLVRELQQHMMKSLSGATDQSVILSDQLDEIATAQ